MANNKLTTFLTVRVTKKLRDRFMKKAQQYGETSDVHRELLAAFTEDRVKITSDPKKPSMEKMYHD